MSQTDLESYLQNVLIFKQLHKHEMSVYTPEKYNTTGGGGHVLGVSASTSILTVLQPLFEALIFNTGFLMAQDMIN